jgi:molybdopterin synthase catalytic subunit
MISAWIDEIKREADPDGLGMILVHNGIVRGTTKKGESVRRMRLSYDKERLERLLAEHRKKEGILDIRAWINSGEAGIGDDIMLLLVAGRFRTDVLPVFESVLSTIKNEIVHEEEIR